MKKKHRLEKFFSSVFDTHVDTENSRTLPNREDVEKDVERILQILRNENGHISSEDSFDRSELAARLEYFQKGYQDVHERYNHLLGKITKKFRPKGNENGSFSIDFSSSDSESSESEPELSHKKSSRIQENKEDQVPIEDYYTLQRQLESANIKITELEAMATVMNTTLEEGQTLTAKLAEREAWIIALKEEPQTMSDSVEALQGERDVLKIEMATLLEKGDGMHERIKLQEAENVIDDLKAETEHLRADNSQLKTDVSNLDLELEASKLQLTDLSATIEQMQEENSTLAHYHNDLQSEKLDLEVWLNEKLSEILSLQAEVDTVQEEATNQIKSFTAQVHALQRERDLLNNQKSELEEHIWLLTCRSVEDEETIKNLQEELKGRIHSEEHTLKSQKDSFDELLGNYKKLEACFQESCEKLQFADRKSEELAMKEETIQSLEAANEKQRKEIAKLEDIHKELLEKLELIEAEKADADKETAKLRKQVQNLEVQIRLSNQKLKVTETENKEKEEGYKTTMQALREEHRELEGKFVTLCGKYDVLDKELRQLKKLADVEISALANGYRKLESVFKEKTAHIPMQLFECGKELKELKNWFALLKNEKLELSVRLEYKEGIISMMKDEAESIHDKLSKTEKELAIVRTKEEELEKRIKVLEEMLGEKKKEVSDKDEAKREAIRQLCLLIEYHRENCVHLSRYITSVLKRSRRS